MRFPGFVGPSYESESYRFDQERLVNWYVAPTQSPGSTSEMALFPTPGVETIGTAGTGAGRAHFFEDGREWAVIGSAFVEIAADGTRTSKGTVATNSSPATISSNGDGGGELFITSGGNGYIYDLTAGTLTQISALDGIADQGGQLDGFFIALDESAGRIRISDLLDGTTWDSTQFAQRSAEPDPWIGMRVISPYIYLFGSQSSDIWYNAGLSPFPFAPHPSGSINYGIAGAFASADANGDLMWIGRSKIGEAMVLRTSGFSPDRVSTHPISRQLQSLSNLEQAIGDAYEESGYVFTLLSVPGAETTWCNELTTGYWHERGTWYPEESTFKPVRLRHHAFAFGENRWLDSETGDLYRASTSLFFDVDSREIRRVRRSPAVQFENQRIFYNSFELIMDVGVGDLAFNGAVPDELFTDATFSAYWEFESSGEDERGSSDLTEVNSPTYGPAVWRNGAQLTEAATPATSPYFSRAAGSATDFNPGTDSFVVASRYRADSEQNLTLITKGDTVTNSGWLVGMMPAPDLGEMRLRLYDGSTTVEVASGTAPGTSGFHSVVAVIDQTADTATLYIDGAEVASADISALGSITSAQDLYVGVRNGPNHPWDGRLDQTVFLTGRTWSADDVETYHSSVVPTSSVDPQVMLRLSNDGGKTWGPEILRSAGKQGEYSKRVRWERLGMATQRVVEVAVSAPVAWRIVDAALDIRQPPRGLMRRAG